MTRCDELDRLAEWTRIRAQLKRAKQLMTVEQVQMLIALREVRLSETERQA